MLKIESVAQEDGRLALRLAGEVYGPWVGELRRLTDSALRSGARLSLDLTDVSFADLAGVALLGDLAGRDVTLLNCSSFITELLRARG